MLCVGLMLVSMSKIYFGVDVVFVDWSVDGVSEFVLMGMVMLLLVDIEGVIYLLGF